MTSSYSYQSANGGGSKQLLSIPLKGSPPIRTHLKAAIRDLITNRYHDAHPDAFVHDIENWCTLRDRVAALDVHQSSLGVASSYYAHLVFLATKFPQHLGIALPWYTAFPRSLPPLASHGPSIEPETGDGASIISRPYAKVCSNGKVSVAQPDIAYEAASALLQLAALHSALGTAESRSGAESIKRAIAAFQTAAGILSHISSTYASQLRNLPPPDCPDLHPSLLDALQNLMLAQAQECFWQKGVIDSMKDATIAKLAMRASDLYALALESASKGAMGGEGHGVCELPSSWLNHISVKRWHFAAAAQFRKSCDDVSANRYGDEIGRLQLAESYVHTAQKTSKRGVSSLLLADLDSLKKIIAANLARGKKDNDLIYLESITPASSLPKIVAAEMAKAVVPAEIAQPLIYLREAPSPAFGCPMFKELVPYGVHVAISIYDDRKESLLRNTLKSKRDELDAIASGTLQSLNLPFTLQALEQPMGLPPSLLRKSEEIRQSGGQTRLKQLLDDVTRVAGADASILKETVAYLDAEAAEAVKARESLQRAAQAYGEAVRTAEALRSKADEFGQTLIAAGRSDEVVRNKFADWKEVIGVLSSGGKELENFLPQHTGFDSNLLSDVIDASGGQSQTQAARALRSALETLDDLLDSRATCLEEAKELVASDDIRPLALREAARLTAVLQEQQRASSTSDTGAAVSIEPAHFEALFDTELQKFARFEDELVASEKAQEDLLEEIKDLNDDFVQSRHEDPLLKRREAALQMLDLAHAKFREISGNLEEGLKFYNTLARLLSDLRRDVKDWYNARSVDIAQCALEEQTLQSDETADDDFGRTDAAPVPPQGPATRTRAQHRAQARVQTQAQVSSPQWGQWQGGKIQFGG